MPVLKHRDPDTGLFVPIPQSVAGVDGYATEGYVDGADAALDLAKVSKSGDTMSGNLFVDKTEGNTLVQVRHNPLGSANGHSSGVFEVLDRESDLPSMRLQANGTHAYLYVYDTSGTVVGGFAVDRSTGEFIFQYGAGVWKNWSPTITGCSVSAMIAKYMQIGNTVHVRVRIQVTSVTGEVTITPPVAMAGASEATEMWGQLIDISSSRYVAAPLVSGGKFMIRTHYILGDGPYIIAYPLSSSVPFPWASGDMIAFGATYEAV